MRRRMVFVSAVFFALLASQGVGRATTLYVNGPSPDCTTIQACIDLAVGGDTVMVFPGTYNENLTIDKNIHLQGAGSVNTIVDGSLPRTGSVVRFLANSPTASIDGFTIRNGHDAVAGGGIQINYSGVGNQVISNCTIQDNIANWGGGVYVTNYLNPTFRNCLIQGNTANYYYGGGMVIGTRGSIERCIIAGNRATGAAGYGGGLAIVAGAQTMVLNTVISGNFAAMGGGGVYLPASSAGYVKFLNCTIIMNDVPANSFGGAIYQTPPSYYNPRTWMEGSIVWDNHPSSSQVSVDVQNFGINHSDIQGGWLGPGTGNLPDDASSDPMFLGWGDYHIDPASSPCRGTGEAVADAPTLDIDGQGRPQPSTDATVDIGADEVP